MTLNFDIDTREITRVGSKTPLEILFLAFPDKYPCRVNVTRSGVAFSFTGTIKVTAKSVTGDLVLALLSMSVTGASNAEGTLNLSTTALQSFSRPGSARVAALEIFVADGNNREISSASIALSIQRRNTASGDVAVDLPSLQASQAEAEAGTNNTKWMTPLRVFQAITSWVATNLSWADADAATTRNGLGLGAAWLTSSDSPEFPGGVVAGVVLDGLGVAGGGITFLDPEAIAGTLESLQIGGGASTEITVMKSGGGTHTLTFTNGILGGVQD
jgi:hypothetical protein